MKFKNKNHLWHVQRFSEFWSVLIFHRGSQIRSCQIMWRNTFRIYFVFNIYSFLKHTPKKLKFDFRDIFKNLLTKKKCQTLHDYHVECFHLSNLKIFLLVNMLLWQDFRNNLTKFWLLTNIYFYWFQTLLYILEVYHQCYKVDIYLFFFHNVHVDLEIKTYRIKNPATKNLKILFISSYLSS